MSASAGHHVAVVGGGPGGSTTAAFLARAGLSVVLFEREPFPRFHVGESLLPATLPLLERLGALETVAGRHFQVKHGATFSDQEMDLERTFYNHPAAGDRFLAVGDAVAFVDPIFSGGVHIAMSSGELAARAITRAFRDGRFRASRFRGYERAVWRGVRPFFRFIHRYYEPAFLELFPKPRNPLGMFDAVLTVLAGGAFHAMPWRTRLGLEALFALARANVWVRRRAGLAVESRLEW